MALSSSTEVAVCPARIYVRDLAAYNAGILHGVWIDLTETTDISDVMNAVAEMLKEGTRLYSDETLSAEHEEYAIHDCEGFGPIRVREYDSFEELLRHVERMGEARGAYLAFIDAQGTDCADEFSDYEVCGPYEEDVDYAWEYLETQIDDLGDWLVRRGMPKDLAACIKFDAADFVFSSRCNYGVSVGRWDGKTYVFEPKR